MARLWRYKRDGQEFGPVTPDDLKLLADSKRLQPTDLVSKDGTTKWMPARSVRGLFDAPKSAARRHFLAWMRRNGVVTPLLALLTLGIGVAFLVYAIHNSGGAPATPPAVAAVPAAPAPTTPTAPVPAPAPTLPDGSSHLLAALRDMRDARAALRGSRHDSGDRWEAVTDGLDDAIERTEKVALNVGLDAGDASRHSSDRANPWEALREIRDARLELRNAPPDSDGGRVRTLNDLTRAEDRLDTALRHVR